ncbi:MAG: hypothetical protein ABJN65_17765 [Parasphingorhabdus sp.]
MATVIEARPDHNSLGKAAFVVGLVGLGVSFIPFIGFVAWLLCPLGILFGIIALRRTSRSMAIAGIVMGAIGLWVCFTWIKAVDAAGESFNADAFNTSGEVQDLSEAPLIDAQIAGLWKEMENNRIAAGKKYGGKRLKFTAEKIKDIGGDAEKPTLQFEAARDNYWIKSVNARFSAKDGNSIASLSKYDEVDFICTDVSETLMGEAYSLSDCKLQGASKL